MWNVRTIEVTGDEPVTRSEAKLFCRIDGSDDDALVDSLISAARQKVENITGLLLREQTVAIDFTDGFPARLPRAPLDLDSISLAYTDAPGNTAAFTDFEASLSFDVPMLRPSLAVVTWPSVYPGGVVTVTADGGYAPDGVPELLKLAIRMLISHWYDDRAASGAVPDTVYNICNDFRLNRL